MYIINQQLKKIAQNKLAQKLLQEILPEEIAFSIKSIEKDEIKLKTQEHELEKGIRIYKADSAHEEAIEIYSLLEDENKVLHFCSEIVSCIQNNDNVMKYSYVEGQETAKGIYLSATTAIVRDKDNKLILDEVKSGKWLYDKTVLIDNYYPQYLRKPKNSQATFDHFYMLSVLQNELHENENVYLPDYYEIYAIEQTESYDKFAVTKTANTGKSTTAYTAGIPYFSRLQAIIETHFDIKLFNSNSIAILGHGAKRIFPDFFDPLAFSTRKRLQIENSQKNKSLSKTNSSNQQ